MVQMNPLDMAKTVLGRTEGKDRATLIEYMKRGGQNMDPATAAWCASFINASLEMAGYSGTGSDMARSFMKWGQAVSPDQLQPGDVGVFPRGNDPNLGHAGLVESYDPATGQVTMVSGNTGMPGTSEEGVGRGTYDAKLALGFRRAEQMQAAGYSPEQIQAAFLQTIRGPESSNQYNVLYGGETFQDMSKHPGRRMPIFNDKGQVEGYSTASGAYGMTQATWEELAKKYGYKDFSKETQDTAAWQLAQDRFSAATKGGSLEEALSSGDPGRINAAAQMLNQTWASLPGGKQPGKAYAGTTYADVFNKALGPAQAGHPPTATVGAPSAAPAAAPAVATADDKKKSWWDKFGKHLAENPPTATASGAAATGITDTPRAVLAANTPTTYEGSDTAEADYRRQNLAQIMARLNSQKLWG